MLAAQHGDTEAVKALIEAGADINLQPTKQVLEAFILFISDSV